ncbi:MAG: F0F1 ATP synthase subunit B [Alphaproteobacteria bacterium]|nr:F0F1 ATP synthase subunit B [Alphaproteobacteria bacterium]
MDLLVDTYFWYTVSFAMFAIVIWKYGFPVMFNYLDTRIESIREEIAKAESLRTEAHELLAQYQRKHRDAVNEADEIIKNAKEHAKEIKAHAEAEIDEVMARREKQLEERVARMEANAIEEIKTHTANLAIEATAAIIADKLDKKANQNLVDTSIGTVAQKLK